jgi:hypothetical protein
MKQKISTLIILLAIGIMPLIQSCRKYPDGPLISFHSRTERVCNTWRVENYQKNGTDYTSQMAGYSETYTKAGNYSYVWGSIAGTGVWAFTDNDADIQLTGLTNQQTHTLVILKLEQKEFWYYYMDGNDRHEFHMVPN